MTRYEYLIKEGYSQSQINQIAKIYKQTNLDISEVILPENPIEEYRRLGNLLIHYNYNPTKEKLLNAYNQIDVYEFENTNLKALNIGDKVNIETDILGKYVEKMLSAKDNNSKISMTFLQENGFV